MQAGTVATKAFDVAGTITLKCNQDDGGITFDRFSWIAAMMKRDDSAQRDATWQASYAQVQQVLGWADEACACRVAHKEPGPENQHGLPREPLSGAMKAFSKHFDCNQGELTGQLRGITP